MQTVTAAAWIHPAPFFTSLYTVKLQTSAMQPGTGSLGPR